jgi:glutamate 5-kinase
VTLLLEGERLGTLFISTKKHSSRERWILNAKPKGTIYVNKCAEDILKNGKVSLLPVGIENVEGYFKKGDVVMINSFAKAVPDYASKDIEKVKGMKGPEAAKILGKKRGEVVKKENIVLLS